MESLHELLVDELKDLYSAENQITKMLPRMAKKAQTPQLRQGFEAHLKQTEEQIRRLERIGQELGASPRGKKCVGMEGLIEEGKELFSENPAPEVLEAGMIGAAQKVEHYEIAAYGTARAHAQQLGLTNVARLLQQTLEEESLTNEQLTRIAESLVNREAINPDDGQGSASKTGRKSAAKKSGRR